MWTRAELKTRAKAVLRISYWKAFLTSLLITFAGGNSGNFSPSWREGGNQTQNMPDKFNGIPGDILPYFFIFAGVFSLVMLLIFAFRVFLGYALEVSGRRYFIKAAYSEFDLNNLGFAFEKAKYFAIIKSMLYRAVINFLWYLVLIIPGIVKAYAYRMVPYILADNPEIGYERALELSTQMTQGQKFKIFVLDLSFIGWYILGLFAFFVGVLFVLPYQNATLAELYLVLRQNALDQGYCNYQELLLEDYLY